MADLKMKDMDLVEAYNKWHSLLQKMTQNKCHGCIKLEEHIKLAKEIKSHKEEVSALKFQMSDEALQQMPDFQGRVRAQHTAFFFFFFCETSIVAITQHVPLMFSKCQFSVSISVCITIFPPRPFLSGPFS